MEYECDGVLTEQRWKFHDVDEKEHLDTFYDCFATIENLEEREKKNYLQFFACYHMPGTSYYWSTNNEIAPCVPTNFTGVPDRNEETRLRGSPYLTHLKQHLPRARFPRSVIGDTLY